jgi:hypothetical protein
MPDATIAAEPRPRRSLRRLVIENLGLATVIFALLECWRPLYFLTDDNLDGAFPIFTGMGRRMMRGESPFYSDYLFGGHYNLLRDSSGFVWHPIYLLAALVTQTPAGVAAIDLTALALFWVTVSGFVCLAHELRRQLDLPLGDARLTLCAQSFTFSMFALCTGSSWILFLANNSALPWLALGIVQTEWRRGLALSTLCSMHHLLGGHLGAALSTSLLLTVFAFGVAYLRRSAVPLISWFGGYAIALLVLSPLFIPAAEGFVASNRSGPVSTAFVDMFAFPALLLPASCFLGVFTCYLDSSYSFGYCPPWYSAAFAASAAAWLLVPAVASRARWSGMQILCAGLVCLVAVLVVRPAFLGEIMIHIPVLRSMRWPFREILQLEFFLHLFLILRPLGGPLVFQRLAAFLGIFIFVVPLFFMVAPSFGPMEFDRALIFSGDAQRYWGKVKKLLNPGEVIVPVIDPKTSFVELYYVPYTLLGAYDYPELFQVPSASGYTVTVPRDQAYLRIITPYNYGSFAPSQEAEILKERPNVRFITLENIKPLRITLSSPNGPIDLVPLLTEP